MLPFHKNRSDLNDVPVRTLLSELLRKEVMSMKFDMLENAIMHTLSMEDHDEDLKRILIKLDNFVKELQIEKEDMCQSVVLVAMEIAQLELTARLIADGLKDDYFDENKN